MRPATIVHIVQQSAHFNQHAFGLIPGMALPPQAGDEFLLFTDASFLLRNMARSHLQRCLSLGHTAPLLIPNTSHHDLRAVRLAPV
jgi:hypothetical protein